MKIQFHIPGDIVTIDTETVTDIELRALGITRESLEEFTKPGLEERIAAIEKTLKL